jgi:2-dehydro-3-deoxyphosphooctonate aldolase (KDO 8-P synthase)
MSQTIEVKDVKIGPGEPLTIIAGPCVIESLDQCLVIAASMHERCASLGLQFIFKASFDKANRSSIDSARGPGMEEGLKTLEAVGERIGVPVTTDIHMPDHAAMVVGVVDIIQIPAFLCRQTDLLIAAAKSGLSVNVKKGQFMSPAEMVHAVRKLEEAKASGVMLTERGTFFGYNRLVNDFIGLGDLMELGYPVCFDVTHSTQLPGGGGHTSAGRPERAPMLAKAATAAGVDALFFETHPDPANAFSDPATVLPLPVAQQLLTDVARVRGAIG